MDAGYDYIIVGAGSAGCVLANRLTEDEDVTVLLLEAGGRDNHPYVQIPLGLGKLQQHKMFDWGYITEPEPHLNNRRLTLLRGRLLGGSSSINVMAYTRGHRADFDRWARQGATGWSYADALPYFKRSELWEGGDNPWRGGSGPLGTQGIAIPTRCSTRCGKPDNLRDGLSQMIPMGPIRSASATANGRSGTAAGLLRRPPI